MNTVAITGTGVFTPEQTITNAELVESYNEYARRYNARHASEIAAGKTKELQFSSEEFIIKASGIHQRYVMDKTGVLDPDIMYPILRQRADDEPSIMAEMAVDAAGKALQQAKREAKDIDAVIVAASNMERAYPAIAVEVQDLLGINGFGFDMNVACSSATFGITAAADMVRSGSVRSVLMVNPEICSGHLEWRDRDCHFIFGDVCTAAVLERAENSAADGQFDIVSTRCLTKFSNNIRNNNGYLRRSRDPDLPDRRDMQFMQEGRKVFKQVVPIVGDLILSHLADEGIAPREISRLWLHQANKAMNDLIGKRVLGREPLNGEQPNILQDYANTSSAGSIIAFSHFNDDLADGDLGVICSFGAGYSVGSVIVRKRAFS